MAEVLVTGGTGLIGGRLVRHLTADGIYTRVLVRDAIRARKCLPEGTEPVRGDLADLSSLRDAVEGVDLVFHCAGISERWVRDVRDFSRVNAIGTLNILQAARTGDVSRFVHLSTVDTMASAPGEPFDELATAASTHELTAYGQSKLTAENYCAQAHRDGLATSIVNAANVFGLHDGTQWGLNRLIAAYARGQVVGTPVGSVPLVFADDVAAALRLSAELQPGTRVIASDRRISLRGLADAVAAILEQPVRTKMLSSATATALAEVGETAAVLTGRPPRLPRGQLHALLAQKSPDSRLLCELGWKPTPFTEALRRTLIGLGAL